MENTLEKRKINVALVFDDSFHLGNIDYSPSFFKIRDEVKSYFKNLNSEVDVNRYLECEFKSRSHKKYDIVAFIKNSDLNWLDLTHYAQEFIKLNESKISNVNHTFFVYRRKSDNKNFIGGIGLYNVYYDTEYNSIKHNSEFKMNKFLEQKSISPTPSIIHYESKEKISSDLELNLKYDRRFLFFF